MADIVVGVAASHTPQLSTPPEHWQDHAERDRANDHLVDRSGAVLTYDELLRRADPRLQDELSPGVFASKHERAQTALVGLTCELRKARPDVVAIVGDDQEEFFDEWCSPTFSMFLGDSLDDIPYTPAQHARLPIGLQRAAWASHAPERETYRVDRELSAHIVNAMVEADFDPMIFSEQRDRRGLGHAFTFVRRRLGLAAETPIVPVFVNTYYPPNVPSANRCHQLGRAIRGAIDTWPDRRVAVVASGGLSHYVIQPDLDWRVLTALANDDADTISDLRRDVLRSGTSEILNWIVAGATLRGLTMEVIDYIPAYRTPAGTGTGMAFAVWRL